MIVIENRTELIELIREALRMELSALEVPTAHTEPPGEDFLTKREAAQLLKCAQSTIDLHRRKGNLRRHNVGSKVLFLREDVLKLAKS